VAKELLHGVPPGRGRRNPSRIRTLMIFRRVATRRRRCGPLLARSRPDEDGMRTRASRRALLPDRALVRPATIRAGEPGSLVGIEFPRFLESPDAPILHRSHIRMVVCGRRCAAHSLRHRDVGAARTRSARSPARYLLPGCGRSGPTDRPVAVSASWPVRPGYDGCWCRLAAPVVHGCAVAGGTGGARRDPRGDSARVVCIPGCEPDLGTCRRRAVGTAVALLLVDRLCDHAERMTTDAISAAAAVPEAVLCGGAVRTARALTAPLTVLARRSDREAGGWLNRTCVNTTDN
jgi:hypothetical protein